MENDKVAPAGGIVVTYTTAGSATAGSDYTALAGSVTIPAGQSSATIVVDVISDAAMDEPEETVSVTLASVNHPSVSLSTSSRSATVTIGADDPKDASISGLVWIDANNDRQQQKDNAGQPLEPGIPGVLVRLKGTARDGSTLDLEAMTDDDGAYRFVALPAGTYEVREEQPAAWIDGQEMLTSATANDTYGNVVVTPRQELTNYSFGERTLRPEFVSMRMFLASTPATDIYVRGLNALAKQRAGDAAMAQAIRDASILSIVSAADTSNSRLAALDSRLSETDVPDSATDADTSQPEPDADLSPGEGEAAASPAPVASPPATGAHVGTAVTRTHLASRDVPSSRVGRALAATPRPSPTAPAAKIDSPPIAAGHATPRKASRPLTSDASSNVSLEVTTLPANDGADRKPDIPAVGTRVTSPVSYRAGHGFAPRGAVAGVLAKRRSCCEEAGKGQS